MRSGQQSDLAAMPTMGLRASDIMSSLSRACSTRVLIFAGLASLSSSNGAHAETLADAIALAYQSNPTLQAQRAQLRSVDEVYAQARSQYGPTVQVEASGRYNQEQLRNTFSGNQPIPGRTTGENFGSAQINVSQPLYTGGRATLAVRGAEWRIRAGREALRIAEGDVVYAVIQAYTDVRRDQAALAIRRTNLAAIDAEAREIAARKRAGEVTLTDLAQAQAQLAAEQANVAVAENQLRTSRIAYASIVGRMPGDLEPPSPLPNLPATIDKAWEIAADASPEFLQARFNEEQSRARVAEARAGERPTVSLRGSLGYQSSLFPFGARNYDRSVNGSIVLSIPIFSAGYTSSQIRQALEANSADRSQIEVARRTMVQTTANVWNQMVTFSGNVEIQQRQVEAATLAFKGMRIEYRAGQRSTLDVLIAEQTLRDAELARLTTEHDAYLSSALVLRYIGRLDAGSIVESLPRYEPAENLRRVGKRDAAFWEPLVRALDSIMLPKAGQRQIPAPPAAEEPQIGTASTALPYVPVKTVPNTPVPGTVSPTLPPRPR